MINKNLYFFCKSILLFFLFNSLYCSFISIKIDNSEKEKTIKNNFYNDSIEYMLSPVICTRSGIRDFILNIYNNVNYKDFLGSCLIHLIDFIENSINVKNRKIFIKKVFDLYIQKIYEVKVVNPHSFLYFLEHTYNHINDLILSDRIYLENIVENILDKALNEDLELLNNDKKSFLKKYSKIINNEIENNIFEDLDIQNSYINLIEVCMSKLIFDIKELDESLNAFKQISSFINHIYELKLIKNEELLNRLLWILTIQFSNSINIQKKYLGYEGQKILNKFINELPDILFSEEIESLILNKKLYLKSNL